jgi:hypothetical protein
VQTLASALPSAEIGTAQQEKPVAITEELWFEIQGAAEDAVAAIQSQRHNPRVKAVLISAAIAGGVAVYCSTPHGRKTVKSLFNAGRNRLAKWVAVEQPEAVEAEVFSADPANP